MGSCHVVVQFTTTMLHIPTDILHIEIQSVLSNNSVKLFPPSLHHARFRLFLLCLSFHLFNNPFAVSPRPFLPNLAVVYLLNPSQLPQTIEQGQHAAYQCRRARHYNRDFTCRGEVAMLSTIHVSKCRDYSSKGIKKPRAMDHGQINNLQFRWPQFQGRTGRSYSQATHNYTSTSTTGNTSRERLCRSK